MDEMNLFTDFDNRIKHVLEGLDIVREKRAELDFSRISVEPPRDASHGDVATNAAMVLAKPLGLNPRALADRIVTELKNDPEVADVSVAGPGFINVRLSVAYWQKLLAGMVKAGTDYGRSSLGAGRKVNVEYVSANPTGPMHVGHCRGAVVGDALANLLAFAGYAVTKEYYINDAGSQIDVLARSAFLRYREAWARRSARFRPASIRAIIWFLSVRRWLPNMARRCAPCRSISGCRSSRRRRSR
jgi:arginyl-tRNA synthetase